MAREHLVGSRGAFGLLLVACVCTLQCSSGGGGDDDDDDSASSNDYCHTKSGGACDCSVECGTDRYGLSCDGMKCTCTKNGTSLGSFGQLGACSYSVQAHADAYNAVNTGCPVAYPCVED